MDGLLPCDFSAGAGVLREIRRKADTRKARRNMEALGRAGVVNVAVAANDHVDNETAIVFPSAFPYFPSGTDLQSTLL